jgi:hypothetical protein
MYVGLGALFLFRLGPEDPALLVWVVLGFVGAGLGLLGLVLLLYPSEPNSMELTPDGAVFLRPNGRRFTLRLEGGVGIRLVDQSQYLGKPLRLGRTYSPYVMFHSATTEQIALTRDAFLALQETLAERGATLVRKRPFPLVKESTVWEYTA